MKVRCILTVEIPDSKAAELRRQTTTDAQLRNHVREKAWSAVKHSDWFRNLGAGLTREN